LVKSRPPGDQDTTHHELPTTLSLLISWKGSRYKDGAKIRDALSMEVISMLSRTAWYAGVVCLSLGLLARAEGQTAPRAAASPEPAAGQIDTQLSRTYIRVGKTGLGHEHGVEGRIKSGTLRIGATSRAGEIVFDTTSFQADTPTARQYVGLQGTTDADTQRQVNANMLGPDVLDVRSYPTATFTVHSIQPLSAKGATTQYRLEGDFTLHGKTRKLTVVAEATPMSGQIRLRGGFDILQSDYGITPYSKAFGAIGVADRLTIWGDLWISTNAATAR
jgi:polyisoprenoid-binding protein YceI